MVKNVIVSNRLPIQVTKLEKSFQITPSSGGLATGVNSIRDENSVWIGWSGIKSEDFTNESKFCLFTDTWSTISEEVSK